ncbi:MAG: tetratricopeptide repeat protein [Verrucomicrobia bacterium]|nr:tetratricopeptide repeat protein [Verrucomicrobiota bacterium]MDA1005944.1 tetratricopeptide repeat protein [Verrucomicrobiota bacterium]
MTTYLRSFAAFFAVAALVGVCPHVRGQEADLRQFDPSDVYFQAWLKIREAEDAEKAEKYLDAFNHYKKAASLFDTVGIYHPEWKPELVKGRQDTTRTSMDKIHDQALREQNAEEQKLEGIVLEGPGTPANRPTVGIKPLTPDEERNIANLQRQIGALEQQLKNTANDRDANSAQLRRALADLETQRSRLARAPLQGEVEALNTRIAQVQQEREAMAAALHQSEIQKKTAETKINGLIAERDAAINRAAVLENNLNVQNKAGAEAVRGLMEQVRQMKALAAEKDRLLAKANVQISELSQQLKESHAEIADLKEERGELLKERDHMATLLKLNETDRVKLLIKQNMDLGQDLNEARTRLEEVAADNNRTAQDLIEAKSQLAIAKARIIQLNTEHDQQSQRLTELEERLRTEKKMLAEEGPAVDERSREEIAVLQGIIDRTLKVQNRRRKAQELLVETIQRKAIEDPEVWGALEMLGGQEVELTPEEAKLVENRVIDGEFIFDNHASPEVRRRADNELQESINVKSSLARRAYSNGRFLVAREFFESILDEYPGHVPTTINLGVVHLRNEDPALAIQCFNDVITLRPDIPYAHFMLGASYYKLGEYQFSRRAFEECLSHDPDNAKAHVFIGSIAGAIGEIANAERHWQDAVQLDPTLSEPYKNLCILRIREGKKKDALDFYRKALENGMAPDLGLETQIGS